MRHQWAIAAVCAAALVATSSAQIHGGSRGGSSMGHGGSSSSGFHGGASFGSAPRFGTSFGSGMRQPSFHSGSSFAGSSFRGFRRPDFGHRHHGNHVFFGTISPGFFGYYGYPGYYGGDFYSTADSYSPYDSYGPSYDAAAAQNDIVQQQQDIDRLEEEVARLREQRASEQDSREAPAPQAQSKVLISTPTLLVFLDKHTQEVQNYAIVGGTLWIFNQQHATKLPMS